MSDLTPFVWRNPADIPPRAPGTSPEEQARLRARLAAAADFGRARIADTASPCARDLAWLLIRLDAFDLGPADLEREVRAAEHLWRALLEVERLEVRYTGEVGQ